MEKFLLEWHDGGNQMRLWRGYLQLKGCCFRGFVPGSDMLFLWGHCIPCHERFIVQNIASWRQFMVVPVVSHVFSDEALPSIPLETELKYHTKDCIRGKWSQKGTVLRHWSHCSRHNIFILVQKVAMSTVWFPSTGCAQVWGSFATDVSASVSDCALWGGVGRSKAGCQSMEQPKFCSQSMGIDWALNRTSL